MALNIMVVDDSAVMRKIITKAINEGRFSSSSVSEASDGAEGMKIFDPAKYDLVLADWNMPNLNGLEFIKKIREIKTSKKIIVIMITTEGSVSKMEEAMNSGADNYITKPFTSAQLEQKLLKYFS